jgi:hypothetical protein
MHARTPPQAARSASNGISADAFPASWPPHTARGRLQGVRLTDWQHAASTGVLHAGLAEHVIGHVG